MAAMSALKMVEPTVAWTAVRLVAWKVAQKVQQQADSRVELLVAAKAGPKADAMVAKWAIQSADWTAESLVAARVGAKAVQTAVQRAALTALQRVA